MTPKVSITAQDAVSTHAFFMDHATVPEPDFAGDWDPLQALLHFQVKAGPGRIIPPADVSRLQSVKDFLREHFLDQQLSLNFLCRRFGLNEFKLKKGFKQLFGNTVFGYVQEMRMKTARRLIVEEKRNVNEVADFLGYSSPNHFSAAFKRLYGFPPAKLKAWQM
ncbi:helix-turn-helix transcriptional regulator [Chitinophaga rhizosphaerae]|uniref:helix-turn-helix transcriptional regulator n=1 Tax=Chitinophaga rhizosphaerae TaxID=1864947 RepID=UPI000F80E07E|nr:AraC family transcriptional regulator [Chitinophaga rhizosphaerae]